jgi:hypothetical protein
MYSPDSGCFRLLLLFLVTFYPRTAAKGEEKRRGSPADDLFNDPYDSVTCCRIACFSHESGFADASEKERGEVSSKDASK